jgi:hypothetical protein
MRRTRWAVFTRMNEIEGRNTRRTELDSAEREWSVRVLPADHNPAFMDGVARDMPLDCTASSERQRPIG